MESIPGALKDGEEVVESLQDRIAGRFTLSGSNIPITGEVIVDVNEEITDEFAATIEEVGIEKVRIGPYSPARPSTGSAESATAGTWHPQDREYRRSSRNHRRPVDRAAGDSADHAYLSI